MYDVHDRRTAKAQGVVMPDGTSWDLKAEYGISLLAQNEAPHFTLTGVASESAPGAPGAASGAIHDHISVAFAWLEDFRALHLSDADTGEPMYPESNGWYWFTHDADPGTRSQLPEEWIGSTGAERAASYLRCSPELFDGVEDREQFDAVVDSLRPQWREEARALRQRYGFGEPGSELAKRAASTAAAQAPTAGGSL